MRCNRLRRELNHQRRHCSASFLFVVVVFFFFRRILFGSKRLLCSAEPGLSARGLGLTRAEAFRDCPAPGAGAKPSLASTGGTHEGLAEFVG